MRWCGVVTMVVLAALVAGCGGHGHGIGLSVTPSSALFDTPFRVRVTGLGTHERVTITVSGRSLLGQVWRAALTARADERGRVDLRNQYLIARLRPVRKPAENDYCCLEQDDLRVIVAAAGGTATAHAQRILRPPSVADAHERPSRAGFYGEWLTPRDARRHTAILLFGGSAGGLPGPFTASMLAGRGYPVLALAYFREPGLPRNLERIPLEYFQRALQWMRQRRDVDPQRIVTFGISRGGELSLLLASTFPNLVHGAIEYVGANVAGASSWTYRGKPLPLSIPVDRIDGSVFAVGGGADELSSGQYVPNIRHDRRGHDRRDVFLLYPDAGHLVGQVVPNRPELATTGDSPIYGKLNYGGSPQADEAAREDSWPRLLRFLTKLTPR